MAESRVGRWAWLGGVVVVLWTGAVACGDDSGGDDPEATTTTVTVGGAPGLIQATTDALWVVTEAGVARIDPTTNAVVTTVKMERPEYIFSDGTSVWASLFEANKVVRIDPATSDLADELDVPDNPAGIVVVADDLWVTSHRGAAVLRFPIDGDVPTATISVGEHGNDGPIGLAAGMDSIWVGTPNTFTVSRIDPERNDVIADFSIPPGANPCGDIAVVDNRVEVSSCRVAPSLSVIDPRSGEVRVLQLPGYALAVTVVDDAAWWAVQVTDPEPSSKLVRVDHDSGSLTVVSVPGVTAIVGVVVAFDSVWVSDEASGTVTRFPLDLLE